MNWFSPRRPTRLKAFTILETLVVMAVSAVLISMAYLALRIVQQQQQQAAHQLATLRQLSTLQWLLARDFRRARRVYVAGPELHCELPSHEVLYFVQKDSSLLRQQHEVVDTFHLPVLRQQHWLQHRPVTQDGQVDEVRITLRYQHDTLPVHAQAWFTAEQLLRPTSAALVAP